MTPQYKTIQHKRFSNLVKQFADSERITFGALAFLVKCSEWTVSSWVAGKNLPSRDNAIKLGHFSKDFARFFHQLARVEEAQKRRIELRDAA